MNGETVEVSTKDGVADAYLSRPGERHGSQPGVLFLMDAFGLRPRIDHIEALEQALKEAGVQHRSELYEGAAHGYTMSDTAAYDEAAAERHFTELFALLDRTIGG